MELLRIIEKNNQDITLLSFPRDLLIKNNCTGKLERINGYFRYFISLGLLSGLVYLFSFSGSSFHNFYDPFISSIDKTGISF